MKVKDLIIEMLMKEDLEREVLVATIDGITPALFGLKIACYPPDNDGDWNSDAVIVKDDLIDNSANEVYNEEGMIPAIIICGEV